MKLHDIFNSVHNSIKLIRYQINILNFRKFHETHYQSNDFLMIKAFSFAYQRVNVTRN